MAVVTLGHGRWWRRVVRISSWRWWRLLMRWIPVPTDGVVMRGVVRGGHGLGSRGLRRRHVGLLHLGIVRIQIGNAAKGRVLTLEGQLTLGRGSQQSVLGRFRRRGRRCGGRPLIVRSSRVVAGLAMISTTDGACGRRERRSMRLMVVIGWFHLHHGATRVGSLVRMRLRVRRRMMILTSWPAGEEALISAVGIGMGRRSRSVRLVMRMVILRQGGVAVPHVHVQLMIRIVVKASALGISRVEVVSAPAAVITRINHCSKSLVVVCNRRLAVLEIGKVIRRYLGRQELRLLVLVLALTDHCWRGAVAIAIAPLPARSDRRRAVQPGSLRAGSTCRGCGVERSAEFL